MGGVGAPTGRSDPNSQFDLAHWAIWARRAPPGPATYLPHPTNGCPAWPSSQAAWGKPGFAQRPLSGREIARDAIWGNLAHMVSRICYSGDCPLRVTAARYGAGGYTEFRHWRNRRTCNGRGRCQWRFRKLAAVTGGSSVELPHLGCGPTSRGWSAVGEETWGARPPLRALTVR